MLHPKFALGLFENALVDPDQADHVSGAEVHRARALEAARQSLILLQE